MTSVLVAVGAVTAIGAVLAALLEMAGKLFADYGDVTVDVNAGSRTLTVEGGGHLLGTLREQGIFIPSACGGRGSCGACKLKVTEGGGPVLPTETPYLSATERADGVRISCQVKVRSDVAIWIPEEIFAIRSWKATLAAIRILRPGMVELRWELPAGERIRFKAGQYAQLKTARYGKVKEEVFRSYSISSSPRDERAVEFIIERVEGGICSTWVCDHLQVGDTAEISGPYGDFVLSDTDREMIMIAAASGMSPIKSILHALEEQGSTRKATFFFSARNMGELFHLDLMKRFEETLPGFAFVPTLTRPPEPDASWPGKTGRVPALIAEMIGDRVKDAEAYLCGGAGLIDGCTAALWAMGMPNERIFYDKFE
ncbi:2Fe-2S iron-sulfur cluster binding domain-containing protein [Candidatus Fermentibacteria bacterium]|nr:2Fe-2S iron-sulfur cluster binding domain-containing protein [Candidatus Fermentibacteria bacterium]